MFDLYNKNCYMNHEKKIKKIINF